MNNIEITNSLFEAISIIVNESIRNLPYDRTIIATIIDNNDKERGKYEVKTRKGSTFFAYSENSSYKLNDLVYVLIPSGDYSERKFILSKYIAGTELIESDLITKTRLDSDWSEILYDYKQTKRLEDLKELYLALLSKVEITQEKLTKSQEDSSLYEKLEKELEQLDKLSIASFGVNIDNLKDYLWEMYGVTSRRENAVLAAAIRQYLEAHPEIVLTALEEYLETKE